MRKLLYRLRRARRRHALSGRRHPLLDRAAQETNAKLNYARQELERLLPASELQGQFTSYWANELRPVCHWLFADTREQVASILEVGSYEGRSATFFAVYFPSARIDCVDTFGGNPEDAAHGRNWKAAPVEARFDANVARFGERVAKHRGLSCEVLPRLATEGRAYDLVFVDGGHFHDDVIVDTVLAWPMLRVGGVLIWDDYSFLDFERPLANPRAAIDRFLDVHEGEFEPLACSTLVAVRKRHGSFARRRDSP